MVTNTRLHSVLLQICSHNLYTVMSFRRSERRRKKDTTHATMGMSRRTYGGEKRRSRRKSDRKDRRKKRTRKTHHTMDW